MISWCIILVKSKKTKTRSQQARSNRKVGYSVERECALFYRAMGSFAMRIPTRAQRKTKYSSEYSRIMQYIDVIAYHRGVFYIIQCKRHKRLFNNSDEKEGILLAATQFDAKPLLCYKQKGLKFEPIL